MLDMLNKEFSKALNSCKNLHASCMNQDFLNLFTRVVKNFPKKINKVIDLYLTAMEAHRSNIVSALYALMVLANVNDATRRIVCKKVSKNYIEYLAKDENSSIAGNARILGKVLEGVPLSNFPRSSNKNTPAIINIVCRDQNITADNSKMKIKN